MEREHLVHQIASANGSGELPRCPNHGDLVYTITRHAVYNVFLAIQVLLQQDGTLSTAMHNAYGSDMLWHRDINQSATKCGETQTLIDSDLTKGQKAY